MLPDRVIVKTIGSRRYSLPFGSLAPTEITGAGCVTVTVCVPVVDVARRVGRGVGDRRRADREDVAGRHAGPDDRHGPGVVGRRRAAELGVA